MDLGILRGLLTAILLLLFLGICAWTWSRNRRSDFDRLAAMPLEDDSQPPPDTDKERSQ